MSGDADKAWRSMLGSDRSVSTAAQASSSSSQQPSLPNHQDAKGTPVESGPSRLPVAAVWAAIAVLGVAAIAAMVVVVLKSGGAGGASIAPSNAPAARSTEPALGLVNINTASAAELDTLPGIGPALAQRIIEDRAARGPYSRIDQLDRVPGIGPKTLAELKPLVTVGN